MTTTTGRWTVFDGDVPPLAYDDTPGPGVERAIAVGGPEGLIVASPPCGVPAPAHDDLARYGDVKARLATDVFHTLGSAPGPRDNGVAPPFMMRDRRAVRRWPGAKAARQKPRWLIPAHGDIVDLDANTEARRRLQDG